MSVLSDKISNYLRLSSEIVKLESEISSKQCELERKYSTEYKNIQKNLTTYLANINTTVEIICKRDKRNLSNDQIKLLPYSPLNACDVAKRAMCEIPNILSCIVHNKNKEESWCEFAVLYNTIIKIFSSIETLKSQAVAIEMANYQAKIDSLKTELKKVCRGKDEFDAIVDEMTRNSNEIYLKTFIQDSKDMEKKFVTEISLPIGYKSCSVEGLPSGETNKIIVSSLNWDLHKEGILVIKSDVKDIDSAQLSSCTTNIITHFLFSYPLLSKKILLCDSCSSSGITSYAGILKNENNNLFFDNVNDSYIKNSEDSIRISLSELNKNINQRIMTLGQSRCTDILEYNHKNPDNPMELILILLNGYPFKYEYAADDINSILKNGTKAGVFTLIVENTYSDEETRFTRSRLPKLDAIENVLSFKIEDKEGYAYKGSLKYSVNTCGENYNIRKLLSIFKEVKNSDSILYLENILDVEDFNSSERRKKYSRVLDVPFGKQGSNIVNIKLDASDTIAHLAVIGTNGSGKTAFLNTFVLSACNLYSPDELEFHMILMKKADFKVFMDYKLPHLKSLVMGDQISRANDVLDFIDSEMTRRANLIGSHGNIYTYNEKASKPLSRCVIVIDEFYQLVENNSDAVQRINMIAQTGRAYGISLVISAITFPMDVREIIPQFGNRFEFKARDNAGRLIPEAEGRQIELSRGRCFFAQGDDLRLVTVAFSGDDVSGHIGEVCKKYPGHQMTVQNIVTAIRVSKEEDVPFLVKKAKDISRSYQIAKYDYNEEQFIRTRLGKTDIYNDYLEYMFSENNNVLFLFGDYLDTKLMEASLIKDVLVLSEDIEAPTVYYLDNNKNAKLRKKDTVIKRLKDNWSLYGKVVYGVHSDSNNIFADIEILIESRENDNGDVELYPVLVVITKADDFFSDFSTCDKICELISRGKDNSVYFAIQCNEPVSFSNDSKYLKDAIIFPGRASDTMCAALEIMPAAESEDGKKLLSKIAKFGLDSKLHILCNKNKLSVFIPYEYDEEYLKSIVDIGDLL